jgi:hypothetical protein
MSSHTRTKPVQPLGPVGTYTKWKVDFALILSCQESAS